MNRPQHTGPHRSLRHQGLTLVELVIILVITAIIAAAAAPSFETLVNSNRLFAASSQLLIALNQGRSEALKRLVSVAACKSTDGSSCSTSSSVFWEHGYIVFVNADGDNPPVVDSGEPILHLNSGIEGAISARLSDAGSTDFLQFLSTGRSSSVATFTLCDSRGAGFARSVTVNTAGRAKAADTRVGGGALSCP